jgi:GntR family transcriptional regulator
LGTFVTESRLGDTLAAHAPLRRELQRWIGKARQAGLDDESIDDLFQDTFSLMTGEGVA